MFERQKNKNGYTEIKLGNLARLINPKDNSFNLWQEVLEITNYSSQK